MEILDTLTRADAHWHPYAACSEIEPATGFYPPSGSLSRAQAQSFCSDCPASEPCLWAAMALEQVTGYRFGIWGGTSASRRNRIAASLPDVDFVRWYEAVVETWVPPPARRPRATQGRRSLVSAETR